GAERVAVHVVELEPVAVALGDHFLLVALPGVRLPLDPAGIAAEPHGAALFGDRPLPLHHVDHRMGRLLVELGRIGPLEARDVARELDAGDLHPEAEAVVGHLALAGVLSSLDFALDATMAEATGHQDAAHALHELRHALALDVLRRDLLDLHLAAV